MADTGLNAYGSHVLPSPATVGVAPVPQYYNAEIKLNKQVTDVDSINPYVSSPYTQVNYLGDGYPSFYGNSPAIYEDKKFHPYNPRTLYQNMRVISSYDFPPSAPYPVMQFVVNGYMYVAVGQQACADCKSIILAYADDPTGTSFPGGMTLPFSIAPTTIFVGGLEIYPPCYGIPLCASHCDPCKMKGGCPECPSEPPCMCDTKVHCFYTRLHCFSTFIYQYTMRGESLTYESPPSNVVILRTPGTNWATGIGEVDEIKKLYDYENPNSIYYDDGLLRELEKNPPPSTLNTILTNLITTKDATVDEYSNPFKNIDEIPRGGFKEPFFLDVTYIPPGVTRVLYWVKVNVVYCKPADSGPGCSNGCEGGCPGQETPPLNKAYGEFFLQADIRVPDEWYQPPYWGDAERTLGT